MEMIVENMFVDGPIATGDSFIGRKYELRRLSNDIFNGKGAVHLVGPTRIGKSSLVREASRRYLDSSRNLLVEIVMGEMNNAIEFWFSLAFGVRDALEDTDKWSPKFEELYAQIDNLDTSNTNWYIRFMGTFKSVLNKIANDNVKLILIIDEFDSVLRVFEQKSAYYQFLRSIYSDPAYNSSGVIISRRRLHLLEAKCEYISTFHGVFSEMPLHAFSDADMNDFYELLECNEIKIPSEGRDQMDYCTGRLPHLCCKFARRMAKKDLPRSFSGDDIMAVYKECIPEIDRHYEDLIKRLEEDGYLDFIFYLSIGAKVPGGRNIEHMRQMGVLTAEQNGKTVRYYSFSKDFMAYIRNKPLKLPAWEIMMSCERKLKSIFKREYPEIDKVTYEDLKSANASQIRSRIDMTYATLNIDWRQVSNYCRNLSKRKENPTVLDVLTLSKIIGVIIGEWTKFFRHFKGDSDWKDKLNVIRNVRDPMAHDKLEYVSDEELAICLKYCEEIIRLN